MRAWEARRGVEMESRTKGRGERRHAMKSASGGRRRGVSSMRSMRYTCGHRRVEAFCLLKKDRKELRSSGRRADLSRIAVGNDSQLTCMARSCSYPLLSRGRVRMGMRVKLKTITKIEAQVQSPEDRLPISQERNSSSKDNADSGSDGVSRGTGDIDDEILECEVASSGDGEDENGSLQTNGPVDGRGNKGSAILVIIQRSFLRIFRRIFALLTRILHNFLDLYKDDFTKRLDGERQSEMTPDLKSGAKNKKLSPLSRKAAVSVLWRLLKFGAHAFLIWNFWLLSNRFMSENVTTFVYQEVPYSEFVSKVRSNKVSSVTFEEKSDIVKFVEKNELKKLAERSEKSADLSRATSLQVDKKLLSSWMKETVQANKAWSAHKADPIVFGTVRLPPKRVPDPGLVPLLHEKNVSFESHAAPMSGFMFQALFTLLALWLPMIPFWFFLQRMRDGAGNPAKKSKNKYPSNEALRPKTTFKDVAGCEGAKIELREFVSFLQDPSRFVKLGAKPSSGILMVGPPGTGKTLLARALAGEAGVPFFAVSASEFVEMYVGRGAARVRQLFAEARKNSPCVVFIDEIDAVGMRRGAGLNEERDQTVIQLLTELDGFDGNTPGVLVLAATNRANVLDPALLRPGRLSRKIQLDNPDEIARQAILKVHLDKVPFRGMHGKDDTESILNLLRATAIATNGFSGAQLANVINEAVSESSPCFSNVYKDL